MEQSIISGWWNEKFAREKKLRPVAHYLKTKDDKKPIDEARMDYLELKASMGGVKHGDTR